MTHSVYSPGSVVQARSRLWRVDAHAGDVLTATTIDGGDAQQSKFYIPFEDIQPGELERPRTDLVGHPATQDLLLRAYRLSMLHGTAPLLSLQRSRVIPKDYQLVPVVIALEMPRVRMLLADDVGLGKTIEAGLILTELLARQAAQRVLVIVPAALREQWREALDYFFHLPARIISTRHRREMERELPVGANPWAYYDVLITSVDYAKQTTVKNQILEQSWDAVIVDEAHLCAKPHQSGPDQSVSMDRWDLARALAESRRIRHLLLLTATPHDGYTDTFASLLDLLDVGAVEGPAHDPRILREVASRYVCQRRREDVESWFEDDPDRSPFPRRDQDEVIVPPTQYETEAVRAVEAYGERVLANAQAGSAQSRTLANWTVLHLHKRALSSPAALRQSLRNRRKSLQQRLAERIEADDGAPISEEVARANVLDEDTGERLTDEEASERTERLPFGSADAIRAELRALETVTEKAEKVTPSRDNKLQKLLDTTLRNALARDKKVVIFTRYVDTLEYLDEQIGKKYADATVLTIHGSLNERQRREIFHNFERATIGILIATDAISEGINLQHAASQVIHYELPWNPNRLEQRNGRVDRFGQPKQVVYIRTMVMDETLDATIMKVLVEKAARIRADYGFSPPYFGGETDILDLISQHDITLGPKQLSFLGDGGGVAQAVETLSEPVEDPFSTETLERIRDESFYGQTHISLPEIEERLQETAQTIGSPEQIERFVFAAGVPLASGLNRFGCRVDPNDDGTYRIAITEPALQTASVGSVIERATFDPEYGLDDPDVTVLDLGHPLVRRLIEEVKQAAFQAEQERYGRTSYRVTEAVETPVALFHLLARYVVNTEPVSIVEELLPVAVRVYYEDVLPHDEVLRLLDATPAGDRRSESEVQMALEDTFGILELEKLLTDAVEGRRQHLVDERRAMREQLEAREGAQAVEWLRGIDDLSPGTFDMLTVTVLYPA